MSDKRFLILGHGGSGTSLLRGLMNAHSQIHCCFEIWGDWKAEADKCEAPIWGNKQPLERMWGKWGHDDIVKLIDDFLIIWIVRRFDKWLKIKEHEEKFRKNWHESRSIYWDMRNRKPDRIIEVSFEDLLLRPMDELRRICGFLCISYESRMLLNGPSNTGHGSYEHKEILVEKV